LARFSWLPVCIPSSFDRLVTFFQLNWRVFSARGASLPCRTPFSPTSHSLPRACPGLRPPYAGFELSSSIFLRALNCHCAIFFFLPTPFDFFFFCFGFPNGRRRRTVLRPLPPSPSLSQLLGAAQHEPPLFKSDELPVFLVFSQSLLPIATPVLFERRTSFCTRQPLFNTHQDYALSSVHRCFLCSFLQRPLFLLGFGRCPCDVTPSLS